VATGGALRLDIAGGALRVIPLPGGPRFRASGRWKDLPWQVEESAVAGALDEEGNAIRSLPLEAEDGRVALECEPGVFGYRIAERAAAEPGRRRRNSGGH
jgi:hypothetical protein